MQSPLKRITVYDFETGGLSAKTNSITEYAGVAVDTESLEIVEEFSVLFEPRLDLRHRDEDLVKEAKFLHKELGIKDKETGVKTLYYKDEQITLKNLMPLVEDLEKFEKEVLSQTSGVLHKKDFNSIVDSGHKEMLDIYFDRCYHPKALYVTKISKQLLMEEGLPFEEAFEQIRDFYSRHKIGNNKPISAGHNIKKFDNPFLEKLFEDNGHKLENYINSFEIDTLEWVRLRWFEMPSYSLGVCVNELGLTLKEAHRALPDTVANAQMLIKLLKSMRGEGSQQSTYVRRKFDFNF